MKVIARGLPVYSYRSLQHNNTRDYLVMRWYFCQGYTGKNDSFIKTINEINLNSGHACYPECYKFQRVTYNQGTWIDLMYFIQVLDWLINILIGLKMLKWLPSWNSGKECRRKCYSSFTICDNKIGYLSVTNYSLIVTAQQQPQPQQLNNHN